MRRLFVLSVLILILTSESLSGSQRASANPGQHSYRPEQGYVPDATTAIAIARAVLLPIYGKETLDNERPLKATLKNDVWTIAGTLNSSDRDVRGGVALIEISKIDACVLRVSHGM